MAGLRVLVVDDNATNRLVLTSQLASWRLQPEAVQDAESALAELAQAISVDPALSRTGVIMLTSTSDLDTAALREAGVKGWLAKPVRSAELRGRLLRIMGPEHVASAACEPALSPTVPPICSQLENSVDNLDGGQVNQLLDDLEVEITRASTALEAFGQQIRV